MKKPIPFGKYYLLDRIAVGGMAEVFKAKVMREEGFEKFFAIKRILPSIAEDDEFIKMFIDEAKIAVQLTHANIAQILDLGKVGDAFFIAMEYVQGKDLRSIAEAMKKKGETLPIPMCCYIMMKVCEGLDYAHNKKDAAGRELNLVHRDVSPQNVLLSFDGEIKLIDFGIAKAANKAAKTQAGILKGKFGYMSPEQVRGLPLDKRSDVFSAGIVLYEVLTGERLFLGESDFSTLEKVRNVEIMPPSTYNRNIPEELEQIVLKALAREVEDRYQTAMELHDDLQSFMYTFGDLFGRKELSAFLKEEFKALWEAGLDDMGEGDAEKPAERSSRAASTPPPPPRKSAPPPPPRLSRPGGGLRGSVPPPPPRARASTPPPPPPKKTVMGMPAVVPPGMTAAPAPAPSAEPSQPAAPAPMAEPSQPAAPAPMAEPSQPAAPAPSPATAATQPMQAVSAPPPRPGSQIGAPPPAGASMAMPPGPSQAAPAPAPTPPPEAAMPEPTLDMEWDDDEMETQIYDKLPEDEKIPGIGEEEEVRIPMAAPQVAPPPAASVSIPPAVPARPRSSALPIVVSLIVGAAVIIAVLIVVFLGKPKTATLVLVPDPGEATVTLDKESIKGPFPVTISDLEAGDHEIVASHTGYETLTLDITLEPGKVLTQSIKLVRKRPKGTGFIAETEPIGADVIINNRKHTEKTPLTVSDLKPGTYTLRFEKEGFLPFSTDLNVVDGKLIQLDRIVLDPKTVRATITAVPAEAEITIMRDGKEWKRGTSPQEHELDPTSRYSLKVEAEEHKEWTKDIEMPKGDNVLSIEAKLEPLEAEGEAEAEAEAETEAGAEPAKGTSGGKKPKKKHKGPKGPKGPKPPKPPKPPPTTAPKGGFGYLSVSTQPWTIVYVDKKKVKNTPLMKYKLPAGKHSVTLLNNDFNIRKTYTVIIAPGQETRIIKNLTK